MTDNTSKGRSQTALLRELLESGKPVTEEMKAAIASFEAHEKYIEEAAKEGLEEAREFWAQLEKDGVTISPSALDAEERAIDLFG